MWSSITELWFFEEFSRRFEKTLVKVPLDVISDCQVQSSLYSFSKHICIVHIHIQEETSNFMSTCCVVVNILYTTTATVIWISLAGIYWTMTQCINCLQLLLLCATISPILLDVERSRWTFQSRSMYGMFHVSVLETPITSHIHLQKKRGSNKCFSQV